MIKELPLTKEILLNNGFTILEIDELLKENLLVVDNDKYKLYSLYELFYYGIKLLSLNYYHKANKCFEICSML